MKVLEKMPGCSERCSILLVTSVPQQGAGIGSLYLQALCEGMPDTVVHWHTEPPFLQGRRLVRLGRLGALVRSLLVRISYWSVFRLSFYRHFVLRRRLQVVRDLMRSTRAARILLTASSPELIALGRHLVEEGFSTLVVVWDDPQYLCRNLRLLKRGAKPVLDDFSSLLRGATSAAVISEAMQAEYNLRFGISCHVIRHGSTSVPRNRSWPCKTLRIGFAGSLYSKEEWNSLAAALELANWELVGHDVELIFIGEFPLGGAVRPKQMRHIPSVSHDKALELLATMDIGYLPYWFDAEYAVVARTSFPGKMTAYAAAGLAIFHHGPEYSSVTNFLERFPFGVSCNSLDPTMVNRKLLELVRMLSCSETPAARRSAMDLELSRRVMLCKFQHLLLSKHEEFQENAVED